MKVLKVLNHSVKDGKEFATIRVKWWSWRRLSFIEEDKKVYRDSYYWRWLETGEYTPAYVVDNLIDVYKVSKRY